MVFFQQLVIKQRKQCVMKCWCVMEHKVLSILFLPLEHGLVTGLSPVHIICLIDQRSKLGQITRPRLDIQQNLPTRQKFEYEKEAEMSWKTNNLLGGFKQTYFLAVSLYTSYSCRSVNAGVWSVIIIYIYYKLQFFVTYESVKS